MAEAPTVEPSCRDAVLVGYGSCPEVLSSPLSFSFYGHIYGYVYSFPIVCVDVDNVFRMMLVSLAAVSERRILSASEAVP